MYNVKDDLKKLISSKENIKYECENISKKLKEHENNSRIAGLTGGVVGTIGGAIATGALILAPFTAGATLPIAAIGGVIGGAGGALNIGTTITKLVLINDLCKDANKLLEADMIETQKFNDKIETLVNNIKQTGNLALDIFELATKGAFNIANISFKSGLAAADVAKIVLRSTLNSSLTILSTIFSIYEVVSTSIDIHRGTVSPQAENLDKMIAQLEIEIEKMKESYEYV
jgi:hypothetical protein